MRWLKWLGMVVLVVVLLIAALWSWSRLRGPTQAQRAALELLETPNAFEGRNAFDAIWVLPHDVPDTDIASVAGVDMRSLAEAARAAERPLPFSRAATQYPDLTPVRGAVAHCGSGGKDCLAKVAAAVDDYAALVQGNARLIERVEALSAYDHYATRLPADHLPLLPGMSLLAWPVTAHAVQFARGEHLPAIEATCRDLATMRRIGANSDGLVMQTVGTALATDGYGALLAAMLREIPRDVPLPASCEAGLAAPSVREASICPAMRGELTLSTGLMAAAFAARPGGALEWLVFDAQKSRASVAEWMMLPCAVDADTLQRDQAFSSKPLPSVWKRFECVANTAGCVRGEVGQGYARYGNRALDHRANLQLLGTLAWLRDQPADGTLAERLARRPANLRSPARDITVAADGRSLEIAQYDTSRGATWSLPLPAYLVESTAASD